MIRGACKLLIWLLCVSWVLSLNGGLLSVSVIFSMIISMCASAVCEWLYPRRHASAGSGVLAVLAFWVPSLFAFLPLFAFDIAYVAILQCVLRLHAWKSHSTRVFALRSAWFEYLMGASLCISCIGAVRVGQTVMFTITLVLLVALCLVFGALLALVTSMQEQAMRMRDDFSDVQRRMREQTYDAEEQRRAAMHHATLAERTRIAREIHDGVGHLLTRAIMQAHSSQLMASGAGDAGDSQGFAAVEATISEAMNAVRRTVHDLDDEGNDFAVEIAAATKLVDGVAGAPVIQVKNEIAHAPAPVTRCFAMTIREALHNVLRHSTASKVDIILREMPALWQLVVQDDGSVSSQCADENTRLRGKSSNRGNVDVAAVKRSRGENPRRLMHDPRGMGLADIEARAQELGGNALCGPNAQGWRVFVSIAKAPWQHDVQRAKDVREASVEDVHATSRTR